MANLKITAIMTASQTAANITRDVKKMYKTTTWGALMDRANETVEIGTDKRNVYKMPGMEAHQ